MSESIAALNGWKYTGRTKDGQWSMYIADTGDRSNSSYTPRSQSRKLATHAVATVAIEPAVERDRLYRQILSELNLHPDDRADLQRRGLTDEQIKQGGFKTVRQWQPLPEIYPTALPGVLRDGRSLNVPTDGYLCPVWDSDGLITAFQIRFRTADDGGRYRWLSSKTKKNDSGAQPHVKGELPVTIARGDKPKSGIPARALNLAEGILKPWISAQRLGSVWIGAAGGNFSASQKHLKLVLEKLSGELNTKTVLFWQDAGATENDKVLRRDSQTLSLLESWGYEVKIAWWDQKTKGSPDCDELTDEPIETLTITEWRERTGAEPPERAEINKTSNGGFPYRTNKDGSIRPAPQIETAAWLADRYRETLAWNVELKDWYRYGAEHDGLWSREDEDAVGGVLIAEMQASPIANEFSCNYLEGVQRLVKKQLIARSWNEEANLIPLRNGVLDRATMILKPHAPGYRFTWQLPYGYSIAATCEPIKEWLLEAQNEDEAIVQVLRGYLKAVVCGRTDLQRFVELIGPGGTGKSTFQRLAIALVGLDNTYTTDLKTLESNKFETSGIYRKRLVLINDSERYGGSVTVLKSLTGQDTLRFEEKFKQAGRGFVPTAMVLLAANEPIQAADYTSGLERRRLTIPFLNRVAPSKQRDLLTVTNASITGEFVQYLPGLLNWVLAMPDDEMVQLVKDTELSVPSLNQWRAESLLNSNPIAEWLDANCIFDTEAKTYVGIAQRERFVEAHESGEAYRSWDEYQNCNSWLYANYVDFCATAGSKPISIRRFSDLLLDLCRNQLKISGVSKSRDARGAFFEGLRIREAGETSPRPIIGGEVDAESDLPPPAPESAIQSEPPPEDLGDYTEHQWAGLLESAKTDDEIRQLYQGLAVLYPQGKHPFKQGIWNLLSRDRKIRIQALVTGNRNG